MQGQRSAVGSLPEVLGFEHGSTSSDSSLEQPVRWNSLRSTSQNRIPDYMMSSDSSVGFLNAVNQPSQIQGEWDFGESSSRVRQVEVSGNDQKTELGWPTPVNVSTGAAVNSDGHRYGSSGLLSMNNAGLNMRGSGNNNGAFFVQSSGSETIPQDLNMNSEFIADEDDDDDDCQVLSPSAFKSGVSANERMPSASSSMSGGYAVEEGDGRRSSCKRKAIEGQSSGSGSSSYTQHAEGSLWHSISARRTVPRSLSIGASAENSSGITLPEPVNSRLGLSVGPENSPVRTVPSSAETTRRNLRLRIASQTQELRNSLLSRDNNVGSSSISSVHPSFRTLPRNNSLEHGLSPTIIDNGQPQGTPAVGHLLSARRNSLSRWQGPSSGTRSGSLAALGISGESEALFESAAASASVPRNLSEHPMFVPPPSEIRSSSQNSTNWNLAGGNVNNPVHVASAPRNSDPSVGAPSSALPWTASRNPPHFPRRLSEYVRRAASLSAADTEALGQSSNYTSLRSVPSASASASASQDTSLPPGPSNPGRHASSSRAMLLERHLDGAFGVPFSLRALAGAPEGRSRLMSEIRNVLDLMRRGEGLRFEDVMILDQSVFLGMADLHDRHRDMRLDVDNMSYEELLALEERIGNVNTGLTEEVILKQLKKRTHTHNTREDIEREPCCVCQEEYIEGVELGALDCGHDFHAECIKQWLSHKNLCPICKTTGLSKAT